MTSPPRTTAPRERWFLRPRVALPGLLAIFILLAILTPETSDDGRLGETRLTTYSTGSMGASVLYELGRRFGWRVDRRLHTVGEVPPATTIDAVLSPVLPPTPHEAHLILEHVRRGGALLYVLSGRTPIADSLHAFLAGSGMLDVAMMESVTTTCPEGNNGAALLWTTPQPLLSGLRLRGGVPLGGQVFVRRLRSSSITADTVRADRVVAVGYPMGAGRVVVVSDPDILRNDVLRVCRWGLDVAAVRMLEYLRDGGPAPRTTITFDEYHQDYGLHPGSIRGILMYLGQTHSGRLLAQLLVAALVLLVAAGVRTVPPRPDRTAERRSPLEHVDALSLAYQQAAATRLAAQRLLRGVRRRVPASARAAGRADGEFLDAVQARHPALRDDVAIVRRAIEQPVSRRELEHAGGAMHRIETTLSSSPT